MLDADRYPKLLDDKAFYSVINPNPNPNPNQRTRLADPLRNPDPNPSRKLLADHLRNPNPNPNRNRNPNPNPNPGDAHAACRPPAQGPLQGWRPHHRMLRALLGHLRWLGGQLDPHLPERVVPRRAVLGNPNPKPNPKPKPTPTPNPNPNPNPNQARSS